MNEKNRCSPSEKLWNLIEMARHKNGLRKADLASAAGVSLNTVCLDSADPAGIPQGRLWLYLSAVGVSTNAVVTEIYNNFMNSVI